MISKIELVVNHSANVSVSKNKKSEPQKKRKEEKEVRTAEIQKIRKIKKYIFEITLINGVV